MRGKWTCGSHVFVAHLTQKKTPNPGTVSERNLIWGKKKTTGGKQLEIKVEFGVLNTSLNSGDGEKS